LSAGRSLRAGESLLKRGNNVAFDISKELDERRQLLVTVDVPESESRQRLRETARRLSRDVRIPGFRPGKAPYNVILQRFGETTIRLETLEKMLDEMYEHVMAGLDEMPYLPAEVADMNLDPLRVKFVIPLTPEVALGDYRAIRKPVEPVQVTDVAVDEALEQIRQRHQVVESVERPADFDDLVSVKGTGTVVNEEGEEETIFDEDGTDLLLDNNQLVFGAEFVTHLVGLSAGDEKRFTVTLPAEFFADEAEEEEEAQEGEEADVASADASSSREATFDITILDVKRRELPALNDELAKEEGDFETLVELRDKVREELYRYAEEQAKNGRLEGMIDDLMEEASLSYPPAAVNHELDHMIDEFKEQVQRAGMQWEDYLRATGDSEESLRERFEDNAVRRLERGLVLRQLIQEERLSVSETDLRAKTDARLEGVDEGRRDYLQQFLMEGRGRESMANEIMLDKVHDRIIAILTGDAPDLAELDALEAAQAEEEE
jgi:trigger factor